MNKGYLCAVSLQTYMLGLQHFISTFDKLRTGGVEWSGRNTAITPHLHGVYEENSKLSLYTKNAKRLREYKQRTNLVMPASNPVPSSGRIANVAWVPKSLHSRSVQPFLQGASA